MIPYVSTAADNYIPQGKLFEMANSKSILYGDVQLQIGTRTFLFYGKAREVDNNTDASTADQWFTYGHLDATGLDGTPTNVAGFKFSPKAITTATNSNAKRAAICTYLNLIANAAVSGGEAWASTNNLGWKTLYDSFVGMKAGSSTNLQVAIRDLYFALIDNNNDLPQAICEAIDNSDYVTINTAAKTVTFKDNIAGYPSVSDNLPDGAAVLTHTSTGFEYVENTDNYSGMNATSITQYAYPASLYYWGKSGILTSETSQQSNFTASKTWDDDETTGIFNCYGADTFFDQTCQPGIGIAEPPPVRNSVCHVVKPVGIHFEEILEGTLAQNFGMKFGNAVDRMRSDDGQIRHPDLTVAQNADARNGVPVAGEELPCLFTEPFVDLFDDHVNTATPHFDL